MPIPSCPGEFGNLIIDIDVEKVYSSWLRDPQIRKRIRDALPPIEDQGEQFWKFPFAIFMNSFSYKLDATK